MNVSYMSQYEAYHPMVLKFKSIVDKMGTIYLFPEELRTHFDEQEGAIRMADVKVNRIAVDQVPPAQRQLISQYAPRAAETLLSNVVLYRIPDEYLGMARNLGWVVSTLRVQADGLRIELGPQGAR